jgi:hypothetical protein
MRTEHRTEKIGYERMRKAEGFVFEEGKNIPAEFILSYFM